MKTVTKTKFVGMAGNVYINQQGVEIWETSDPKIWLLRGKHAGSNNYLWITDLKSGDKKKIAQRLISIEKYESDIRNIDKELETICALQYICA